MFPHYTVVKFTNENSDKCIQELFQNDDNKMFSEFCINHCIYVYLISFTDSCKYMLILNLLAASHFKHGGTGAVKDGESCGALIKHLRGTFHRSTGSLVAGDSVVIGLGHPPKTDYIMILLCHKTVHLQMSAF